MRSSGAVLAVTPSPQLTCSFAFLCPPFPISFLGESADVLLDHVSRAFRNTLESPAQSVAKFCVAASESRRSQPASPPPAGGSWALSPASPGGFGWHLHAACDETEMQTVGAMSSKPHGRQAAAPGWHRARHLAERSRDSPAVTVRPFPRQDGPARSLKAGVAFQCPSSLGTVPAGWRRGQQAQDAWSPGRPPTTDVAVLFTCLCLPKTPRLATSPRERRFLLRDASLLPAGRVPPKDT